MRRFASIVLVVVFALSFVAPALAADAPAKILASDEIATQATDTVTTWLKRAGSSKPEVRQRAWDTMTEQFQQSFRYAGDPANFSSLPSNVYSFGDVTIEENNQVGVSVTLSGLINKHGLYNVQFMLTNDYLIDNFYTLPDVAVPDDLTSVSLKISLRDDSIKINHAEIAQMDAILLTITNKGEQNHQVQIYRLNDGQTVDALLALIQSGLQTTDVAESYGYAALQGGEKAKPKTVGLINVKPGTLVVTGFLTQPTPDLIGVYATITIKK